MNTIRNGFLNIITALCLLTLTACNHSLSSDSETSDINNSSADITSEIKQNSLNAAISMVKEQYNVTLPVITAGEALEMVRIDWPEYIDGHSVDINQYIGDGIFSVSLFDRVGASGVDFGTGFYDIKNKEYHAMKNLPYDGYCAWNNDYIVFKEYNGDFTTVYDDDSVKLYLYDMNAQESRLIYTYSFDRYTEIDGNHWINNIVLANNKIYFDDIIGEDSKRRAYLFSYDISSGEVKKLVDDAQNPIAYKNTVLYLKLKNGQYEINSLNGEYELEMKGHVQRIVSLENGILSLDVLASDDIKHETTWGIKNMLTDECILKTTRTISNLTNGDMFLAFTDFGKNYPPIVYNAKDNNFIVFNDLIGRDVTWYFNNDIGIVRTIGEESVTYMFKLKQT